MCVIFIPNFTYKRTNIVYEGFAYCTAKRYMFFIYLLYYWHGRSGGVIGSVPPRSRVADESAQ